MAFHLSWTSVANLQLCCGQISGSSCPLIDMIPSNHKILIVDDDAYSSKILQFYLNSAGEREILLACDGVDGVEKCMKYQPELVLMDYDMPFKNGLKATKELRTLGFDSPILIVTACEELGEKECIQAGANVLIRKSTSMEKFLCQIEMFFNGEGDISYLFC